MFTRFSNAIDALLAVQQAVDAANSNEYYEMGTSCKGAYPFIDLFKNGDDAIVTAELPGLKKEDIHIEIKDNLFRIWGERNVNYPENSSVHRLERRGLKFDRTIKLPLKADLEKVKAEYNNGILKVTMPRAESDKPKQIKVA